MGLEQKADIVFEDMESGGSLMIVFILSSFKVLSIILLCVGTLYILVKYNYDEIRDMGSLTSISDYLINKDNYRIYHSLDDYLTNKKQDFISCFLYKLRYIISLGKAKTAYNRLMD